MQALMDSNPAVALRKAFLALQMPGMVRWDLTGQALLVSDAPRRCGESLCLHALRGFPWQVAVRNGLLFIDWNSPTYRAVTEIAYHPPQDQWQEGWQREQALLASILTRSPSGVFTETVHPLRRAMLACAQGETTLRAFLRTLRVEDARALRCGETVIVRAAAAQCARELWTAYGIGLPAMAIVDEGTCG